MSMDPTSCVSVDMPNSVGTEWQLVSIRAGSSGATTSPSTNRPRGRIICEVAAMAAA
jgi:hypothetical protein